MSRTCWSVNDDVSTNEQNAFRHDMAHPSPSSLSQQGPQSTRPPSRRDHHTTPSIHQRRPSELESMLKNVDGFIDATLGKKHGRHHRSASSSAQPRKPPPAPHSHAASYTLPARTQRSRAISTSPSSPTPPAVPPKNDISAGTMSRKGEHKTSIRDALRLRFAEKIGSPDPAKVSRGEGPPARTSSLRGVFSRRSSNVRKLSISYPITKYHDLDSRVPQGSVDPRQPERTGLAQVDQAPSTAATTSVTRTRNPVPPRGQEKVPDARLQPSPKHDVEVARRQVSQRSLKPATDTVYPESLQQDVPIRLQAERGTQHARTTTFGDFIDLNWHAEHEKRPLLPAQNEAFRRLTRRSTLGALVGTSTARQADGIKQTRSDRDFFDERASKVEDPRPVRRSIKTEWIAAASACALDEPLEFEPCRSCGLPFDGGSNTQKTCKGQLCGDCIAIQPKCLACKKSPFNATSEMTQHGILCRDCADDLPHPCDFCGKVQARKYQRLTDERHWLCDGCVEARTPHEIGPGKDWPHDAEASEVGRPIPRSQKLGHSRTVSKQLPPTPRDDPETTSSQWPKRFTSLTSESGPRPPGRSRGVSSSISPAVLKRNYSPLSELEQELVAEDAQIYRPRSQASGSWQTDVPSESETIGASPSRSDTSQPFMILPALGPLSPFKPDIRRIASSIYPEEERIARVSTNAPPMPAVPAAYNPQSSAYYGIPSTPYESERHPRAKTYLKDSVLDNRDKRSTLMSILNLYFENPDG